MDRKPCPECGSREYGSVTLADGALRFCHGYLRDEYGARSCSYGWRESQDAEHFEGEPETGEHTATERAAEQPAAGPWVSVEGNAPPPLIESRPESEPVLILHADGTVRLYRYDAVTYWYPYDDPNGTNPITHWAEIRRPKR